MAIKQPTEVTYKVYRHDPPIFSHRDREGDVFKANLVEVGEVSALTQDEAFKKATESFCQFPVLEKINAK